MLLLNKVMMDQRIDKYLSRYMNLNLHTAIYKIGVSIVWKHKCIEFNCIKLIHSTISNQALNRKLHLFKSVKSTILIVFSHFKENFV